jgi:hypothetical protein
MMIGVGLVYFSVEAPFANYFRRCIEIGMTDSEIRKNFPYLKVMYQEMVLNKLSVETIVRSNPNLEDLYLKIKD